MKDYKTPIKWQEDWRYDQIQINVQPVGVSVLRNQPVSTVIYTAVGEISLAY